MADIHVMPTKKNDNEPPVAEEPDVFVCSCGCATHFLLSTNETQCPSCGLREPGTWKPSGLVLEANEEDPAAFIVYRPGEPIDVAIARFKRALMQDGMQAAVVFNEDGRIISHIKARPADTSAERQRWGALLADFKRQVFLDG